MKCLLFGFGSIGQRHARNLLHIAPECNLIIVDPYARPPLDLARAYYTSPELAAQHHKDSDFAIIASPDINHNQQMAMLTELHIPFYVEKPACTPQQLGSFDETIRAADARGLKCAVGFQYRFHKNTAKVRAASSQKSLRFCARDSLLDRYGPNVLGAMLAHPIDTALWCLGEAKTVEIESDGVRAKGRIIHKSNAVSSFDCDMDARGRVSQVKFPSGGVDLPPDDTAYVRCLSAYLDWLQTGKRDYRTATLAEGRAVAEVMWKCKSV